PPNAPPSITISRPRDPASVVEGQPVTFTGSATDPEDGALTDAIEWISDRDGSLGTGGSVTVTDLSVGEHVVTASARDSEGLEGTAEVRVVVTAAPVNTPPAVVIAEPEDGSSATEGEPVAFTASATDAEDGNLAAAIAWTSD